MTILLSSTFAISKEVLPQEVSDETALLDLQREIYIVLDAIGTCRWQLLQDNNCLLQVFYTMFEEYVVDDKQLREDLNELLDELL